MAGGVLADTSETADMHVHAAARAGEPRTGPNNNNATASWEERERCPALKNPFRHGSKRCCGVKNGV